MRWRTPQAGPILALMPLEPAFASLETFTQPQFAQAPARVGEGPD